MSRRSNQLDHDARITRLGYQILRGRIEHLEPRVLLSRAPLMGEAADTTSLYVKIDIPHAEIDTANLESGTVNDNPGEITTLETHGPTDAERPTIEVETSKTSKTPVVQPTPVSITPDFLPGVGDRALITVARTPTSLANQPVSLTQQDASTHRGTTDFRHIAVEDVRIIVRDADRAIGLSNVRDSASISIAKVDHDGRLDKYVDRHVQEVEFEARNGQAEHAADKSRSQVDDDPADAIVRTKVHDTAQRDQNSENQGPHDKKALLATARAMAAIGELGDDSAADSATAAQVAGRDPYEEAVSLAVSLWSSPSRGVDYPTGHDTDLHAASASSGGGFDDGIAARGLPVNGISSNTQELILAAASTTETTSIAPVALLTVSLGQPLSRLAVALDGSATGTPEATTIGGAVARSLNVKRRRSRRDTAKRSKHSTSDTDESAVPSRPPRDLESTGHQALRAALTPRPPQAARPKTAWLFEAALVSLSEPPEPRDTPGVIDQVWQETTLADDALTPLEVIALGSGGAALTRGVLWLARERLIRGRSVLSPALPVYNGPTVAQNA